jgi:hypothetical protein
MSEIRKLGYMPLSLARKEYDTVNYEGCSGCEHIMSEGVWIGLADPEVFVTNERDVFGPGEVWLECRDCKKANTVHGTP